MTQLINIGKFLFFFRMARQCRKPPIVHFFSRRYTNRNDRNSRQPPPPRLASRLQHEPSTSRQESHPNYTYINSYTLSSMARRLENLLTEQMRVFTTLQARPPPLPPNNRSSPMVDLGEHILATRLHGCVVRVNRLWGKQSTEMLMEKEKFFSNIFENNTVFYNI